MLFWGSFGQKFHSVWFFKFHEKSAVESFCFAGSYRNMKFYNGLKSYFWEKYFRFSGQKGPK